MNPQNQLWGSDSNGSRAFAGKSKSPTLVESIGRNIDSEHELKGARTKYRKKNGEGCERIAEIVPRDLVWSGLVWPGQSLLYRWTTASPAAVE